MFGQCWSTHGFEGKFGGNLRDGAGGSYISMGECVWGLGATFLAFQSHALAESLYGVHSGVTSNILSYCLLLYRTRLRFGTLSLPRLNQSPLSFKLLVWL